MLLLAACAFHVAACTSTDGATPEIDAIEAASGPAGSVVLLEGRAFGLSDPDVRFDGTAVNAGGSDTRAIFTVPYDQPIGTYDVTVVFDGTTSNSVQFEVTGPDDGAAPSLDGGSVRYLTLGPAAAEDHLNIVVFGENLDTNTTVTINGTAVRTFHPARPLGSLLDAFTVGYILQGLPVDLYGNVLAARLSAPDGNLPSPGATITVSAANPNGTSADLEITIPEQDLLLEFDRIDANGVTWPPAGVWRTDTVNTLGRTYTAAGFLADQRLDDTVADPQAGSPFSDADVVNFRTANRDLDDDVFSGEWYFHVSLVSTRVEPNPGLTTFGRMDDTANRSGMVMFVSNVGSDGRYLRSLMHEIGHGLNLSHCEGDGTVTVSGSTITPNVDGTTIMNQTRNSAADWVYEFSGTSTTHFGHSANEVTPGAGNMTFNSINRDEGRCAY